MSRYWVFGCGGIGQEVAHQLITDKHQVLAISRQTLHLPKCDTVTMDITKEANIPTLANMLDDTLPDYIINTIGMLHTDNQLPEKHIKQVSFDWLTKNCQVNVLPTLNIAKALANTMRASSTVRMISLSARVGSISDNHLGGWYSYRMSKAALNMLIKNIAIEWKRQYKHSAIYGYHPGTVDTPLSQPFQSHVPPEKLFSPQKAAQYLLRVFHSLDLEDTGSVFDWQGQQVPS